MVDKRSLRVVHVAVVEADTEALLDTGTLPNKIQSELCNMISRAPKKDEQDYSS